MDAAPTTFASYEDCDVGLFKMRSEDEKVGEEEQEEEKWRQLKVKTAHISERQDGYDIL